ncbi:MAG: DUF1501 domain-containing protein [Pirellulales bacterium]
MNSPNLAPRCPGPIPRREFLQAGSLLVGGIGLSDLLRLRAAAAEQGAPQRQTSVILVWLEGGPSQFETYDPKPDAPAEYRGEFGSIATAVPGLRLCELLPLHAQAAGKFNVIRSIAHDIADHPGAAALVLSGRRPANISDPVSKFPDLPSIANYMRRGRRTGVPNYVSNDGQLKGGGPAYLGAAAGPFVVEGDPNSTSFKVDHLTVDPAWQAHLRGRVELKRAFDRLRRDLDQDGAMQAGDEFDRQALDLLSSTQARDAFDIHREPARTRDRYGRHEWGQRLLLARRLVEAGCGFVTVQLREFGTAPKKGPFTWDDHGDAEHIFNAMRLRLPVLDAGVTALVEDLCARGRDRDVLVIVMGEFGRTPRVNMGRAARPVNPGRDHWPGSMSVLAAGGGMRTGQVIGSTTRLGDTPATRRLSPQDLLSTIYRHLGIDPEYSLIDFRGRPLPILPAGKPIEELLPPA